MVPTLELTLNTYMGTNPLPDVVELDEEVVVVEPVLAEELDVLLEVVDVDSVTLDEYLMVMLVTLMRRYFSDWF